VNSGSQLFPAAKYAGSALSSKEYPRILTQVIVLLSTEQLYLQPGLTLKDIADRLKINSKYISQAINGQLQMSFTDFINDYRVEEAKKQLLHPDNKLLTLEAIGQKAGFQSKSTFFTLFKKKTGLTPLQFVKSTS
jgi:AraC-like DNA-binding protein